MIHSVNQETVSTYLNNSSDRPILVGQAVPVRHQPSFVYIKTNLNTNIDRQNFMAFLYQFYKEGIFSPFY